MPCHGLAPIGRRAIVRVTPSMLDPLLTDYVRAVDDNDADRRLTTLLDTLVVPLARVIAARKLRARTAGPHSGDVEDVVGEATLLLIERLQALRDEPGTKPIEDFPRYTATVVRNTCAHHLRRKYPGRSRLKNRLRYLFGHEKRFALWMAAGEEYVCGFAEWRPRAADSAAGETLRRLSDDSDPVLAIPQSLDERRDLARLVGRVLETLGGPVAFDHFIGALAAANQVDARSPQIDPSELRASQQDEESRLDRRRTAERLWFEIQALPVHQRVALLLNMRDVDGAGVLWLFPVTGVASIRTIARTLEMPDLELAELWGRLPIDDEAIAGRLACTRQQVINLRMSARKRLKNRMAGADPAAGESAGRPANLRRFSTSLGK